MDSRTAPNRLRSLPSWLLNQSSQAANFLVSSRLATLREHRYQFSMLAALEEFGPLSQVDLGRHCGLDRSDVTGAVTDLEARRLVQRAPDPQDRRRNTVRITATGRRHLGKLDELLAVAQDELLAPLTAAERHLLVELLTRLTDHHAAPGAAPPAAG
jgi:MarR family transcriptional regulator, lower aerobic nicotinate degradation pathway regulator